MKPAITTEQILTHRNAFGLTKATPLQRALCRILDGQPLGELESLPELERAVGYVPALRGMGAPYEAHVLAAIRSAKSMIAAAKIVQLSQTVDLSGIGAGDIVRIPLAALKLDGTRPVMDHLVKNCQAKPALRPLLIGEPTNSGVSLRHPSGHAIEVTPIPIDRAGGSALSVWNAGIVLDEEPRMLGEADGVKNWDHVRDAVLGRILPGGQFLGIGSPWAPMGPIYELAKEHGGKPTRDVVVFRACGPDMNPSWWTPERIEDLRRRSPTAYRTDVLAEFADVESSLISSAEVDRATRKGPLVLEPEPGHAYVAAMDPGTRGNAWTLVVCTRKRRADGRCYTCVAFAKQWRGSADDPLNPDEVLKEIAEIVKRYGVVATWTDQLAADFVKAIAQRYDLAVADENITALRKIELFESMRMRLADNGLEIPDDPVFRADLLSIRKRIRINGISIHLPQTADGRHADFAPALAIACAKTLIEALGDDTRPEYLSPAWLQMVEDVDAELRAAGPPPGKGDWVVDAAKAVGCDTPGSGTDYQRERARIIRARTRGGPREAA